MYYLLVVWYPKKFPALFSSGVVDPKKLPVPCYIEVIFIPETQPASLLLLSWVRTRSSSTRASPRQYLKVIVPPCFLGKLKTFVLHRFVAFCVCVCACVCILVFCSPAHTAPCPWRSSPCWTARSTRRRGGGASTNPSSLAG